MSLSGINMSLQNMEVLANRKFTHKELLNFLWDNRLKASQEELVEKYCNCLKSDTSASQNKKFNSWTNEVLSTIKNFQNRESLLKVLSANQLATSLVRKWLNRITGAKTINFQQEHVEQNHVLQVILTNLKTKNSIVFLCRCYQLTRQINENTPSQSSQETEHFFSELLLQLMNQEPESFSRIDFSNLSVDDEAITSSFFVDVKQNFSKTNRRSLIIRGLALAALGMAGFYYGCSKDYSHSTTPVIPKNNATSNPAFEWPDNWILEKQDGFSGSFISYPFKASTWPIVPSPTSLNLISECLESPAPESCGLTILENIDNFVQFEKSKKEIDKLYSNLVRVNSYWATKLATACIDPKANCFPPGSIHQLELSQLDSLELACTQSDLPQCEEFIDNAFRWYPHKKPQHVQAIFDSCLHSNTKHCTNLIDKAKTSTECTVSEWVLSEACIGSEELVCHEIALKTFERCITHDVYNNSFNSFIAAVKSPHQKFQPLVQKKLEALLARPPVNNKKIISTLFSIVQSSSDINKKLATKVLIKTIGKDSIQAGFIIKEYGTEQFVIHLGEALHPEFWEIVEFASKFVHSSHPRVERFFSDVLTKLEKDGDYYGISTLAAACIGSNKKQCAEFISKAYSILKREDEDYLIRPLVEACITTDTEGCARLVKEAFFDLAKDRIWYDFVPKACLTANTKQCINIMPQAIALRLKDDLPSQLAASCELLNEPKAPIETNPQIASLALQVQTPCNRLLASKEYQEFINPPPPLINRIRRIIGGWL